MKIKHFVIASLSMVILYTVAVTVLTAVTGADYSSYHAVFAGVFGGELICSCVLKVLEKDENSCNDSVEDSGKDNV